MREGNPLMKTAVKKRENKLNDELKRITEIIVTKYRPEKIILFGSFAQGKIHEWSDLDLVIIKDTRKRFFQRLHEVHLMTSPKVGVNFIVYTPAEVKRMIEKEHYFITDEILGKGKVLYEKAK
jgi:predicted nucleotidyltransferase